MQLGQCYYSAGTVQALTLVVVALKWGTAIHVECLTLCLTHGMKGVTLSYCYSGDYPTQSSGAVFEPYNESLDVWACLGVNPLDIPRTQNWASEGKHSQKPTMLYHPTLTLSSVNHLSHQWTAQCLK